MVVVVVMNMNLLTLLFVYILIGLGKSNQGDPSSPSLCNDIQQVSTLSHFSSSATKSKLRSKPTIKDILNFGNIRCQMVIAIRYGL